MNPSPHGRASQAEPRCWQGRTGQEDTLLVPLPGAECYPGLCAAGRERALEGARARQDRTGQGEGNPGSAFLAELVTACGAPHFLCAAAEQ